MKNILNTLGGALSGGLGDKLQSTLGGAAAAAKNQTSSLGNVNLSNLNLGGMLGSAAVGGLIGALFSSKNVAKVAKGALVVGGTAAAGALAWKFYQKWSQSQITAETVSVPAGPSSAPGGWPTALEGQQPQQALPPAENTALLLLEAMVFAARADGHIDEQEKTHIHNAVTALFPQQDMNPLLDHLLTKPIDPHALAARIHSAEEARDLYRLSCTIITIDNFMERSYLDGLAQALRIPAPEKEQLEREAQAAGQG